MHTSRMQWPGNCIVDNYEVYTSVYTQCMHCDQALCIYVYTIPYCGLYVPSPPTESIGFLGG